MNAFIDTELMTSLENGCKKFSKKEFKKNELITSYLEKRKQIFILLSGETILVRYDEKGNKDIVDFFRPGNVFGEAFYNVYLNSELSVIASKACTCLTIMVDDILHKCDSRCKFHEELNRILMHVLLSNTTHLNSRIEIISKRTIREKLRIYFEVLSTDSYSKRVTLPFSLTDLSDYLCVNRSAMMRELKALEEDQIIKKVGKNSYLLLYK